MIRRPRRCQRRPDWLRCFEHGTRRNAIAVKGAPDAATTAHDPGRALRPRLVGPPGCRSLSRRPAARPARLRRAQRLRRRPRVHRRSRVGPRRRPATVPQDAGRGLRDRVSLPGDPGLEVLALHPQARARRRLQVDAAPARHSGHLDHRARRRHPDRQADGGDHRVGRRVLLREPGPRGHARHARGRLKRLLGGQPAALRLQTGQGRRRRQGASHPRAQSACGRGRAAHFRDGLGRSERARHHPHAQRRRHPHDHGQALAQDHRAPAAEQRGLHRHPRLGTQRQRRFGAGAGRGRLPGHRDARRVPVRTAAAQVARAQEIEPAARLQPLPALGPGRLRALRREHVGGRSQGRPLQLLRLPVEDQEGLGDLLNAQVQRARLRAHNHRTAARPHPDRAQHPRTGADGR